MKKKKVVDIRFQLGASFKVKTVELVYSDGSHDFLPLSGRYANQLWRNGIVTEGTFAVEG